MGELEKGIITNQPAGWQVSNFQCYPKRLKWLSDLFFSGCISLTSIVAIHIEATLGTK
jgi:hypothetical protein